MNALKNHEIININFKVSIQFLINFLVFNKFSCIARTFVLKENCKFIHEFQLQLGIGLNKGVTGTKTYPLPLKKRGEVTFHLVIILATTFG